MRGAVTFRTVPRVLVALLLLASRPLAAQGTPYVPLDHPLLPLIEHLIARGDLAEPSPMSRPFPRADLRRLLDSASGAPAASAGVLATLRERFPAPPGRHWFRVEPRAGLQAYTTARRDLLHPSGSGDVQPYAEATAELGAGPLVLVSRPVAENRLKHDPDWSGAAIQQTKNQAYRFAEAYLGAHFGPVRLFFGQMDRNWGPATSAPGIGLSSYGYPRTHLGLELRLRDVQIDLMGAELTAMESAAGEAHRRSFMAHRLGVRVTRRLHLGVWETAVLAGPEGSLEPSFRNPLLLLAFPAQLGLADHRNTLLGGDLRWQPRQGFRLEAQAAIDDRWRSRDDPDGTGEVAHPGRWAVTLSGAGALGRAWSWRATAAAVSNLAFRTADSTQSLIDRGVGIGPHHTDNLLLAVAVSAPVGGRWLVSPDAAILWQGEGRIDAPFPAGAGLSASPELFQGTVATTYRLGAALAGGTPAVGLRATAGVHHTSNAGHVRGRSRTRLEARVLATIGLTTGGVLR